MCNLPSGGDPLCADVPKNPEERVVSQVVEAMRIEEPLQVELPELLKEERWDVMHMHMYIPMREPSVRTHIRIYVKIVIAQV